MLSTCYLQYHRRRWSLLFSWVLLILQKSDLRISPCLKTFWIHCLYSERQRSAYLSYFSVLPLVSQSIGILGISSVQMLEVLYSPKRRLAAIAGIDFLKNFSTLTGQCHFIWMLHLLSVAISLGTLSHTSSCNGHTALFRWWDSWNTWKGVLL